ncbi:MAG: TraR/DksA family transcriptional regulator [bacterium]
MQSKTKEKTYKKDLKEILLFKKEKIQGHIAQQLGKKNKENSINILGLPMDRGDLSNRTLELDISYEVLNMHTKDLKAVEQALTKLKKGTYGICEECGKQIGTKRLQAIPSTSLCVNCQNENEKKGAAEHEITKINSISKLSRTTFSGSEDYREGNHDNFYLNYDDEDE